MTHPPPPPSYEELQSIVEELQAEITPIIVIKQELIDAQSLLDREQNRFQAIHACSESLLHAENMESFTAILLDAVLEAFEFEVSLLMQIDVRRRKLNVVGHVGFDNPPKHLPFNIDWLNRRTATILPPGHLLFEKWSPLGLSQAIVCPFFSEKSGSFDGLVLGGITRTQQDYFYPIRTEVISSFSVLVAQAGALLSNYNLKTKLQVQNIQLEKYSKNLEAIVDARTKELRRANEELDVANRFIRKMFGRYLSDSIVDTILKSKAPLDSGGEKRCVTLLMSDLRGFTVICERFSAEDVLEMINIYLGEMTEIILRYNGTIDEFIGDSIFALFGVPFSQPDDPIRAVACALEMQLAMEKVNQNCKEKGYPMLEQGIGINTGDVIVGNIGSTKRTKYGVVGRNVNLTARLESLTVGGQILIAKSTKDNCKEILDIAGQQKINAKGLPPNLTFYDVQGIYGEYNLFLPKKSEEDRVVLSRPLRVAYAVIVDKCVQTQRFEGHLTCMGNKIAELVTSSPVMARTNLKLSLFDDSEKLVTEDLFAKVVEQKSTSVNICLLRFTYVPPEAQEFLDGRRSKNV